MADDYSGALALARRVALAAGATLRDAFHRADAKPGVHLDRDIEVPIRRVLTSAYPDWGYLGEETGAVSARAAGDVVHYWIVDPNDGTAAFERGFRGASVAIAALRDGVPVLGVVYSYVAPDDEGDLFAWAEGCGPLTRNDVPIARAPWDNRIGRETVVYVSHDADRNPAANQKCAAPGRFLKTPSIAYRLALAAAGEAEAGVSLSGPGAWDYAAGHALLRSVGGEFVDEHGRPVTYTANGESSTGWCFGGAPAVVHELCRRPWHEVGRALNSPSESTPLVGLEPGRSTADVGLLRRAQGALLGQLAGDALGSLVEFATAPQIKRRYPNGVTRLADGGAWDTIAGQPTDDSELALMLARSILPVGAYDAECAAEHYYQWYRSGPFDMGFTTRQALRSVSAEDVAAGTAAARMRESASDTSQSNGSLMRISPLGIWGHSLSPEALAELARTDSALTHPHRVCQEACAVYTIAVAHAVGTGARPDQVYAHALAWAERACAEPSVVTAVRDAATGPPADFTTHQGWVLIALQNAFHQLLHAPSLEDGVERTVAAGGDTDTNAAIAGALLGAVHGREAIPRQWRQMVLSCRPLAHASGTSHPRPAPFWPVDALEIAERLALALPR